MRFVAKQAYLQFANSVYDLSPGVNDLNSEDKLVVNSTPKTPMNALHVTIRRFNPKGGIFKSLAEIAELQDSNQ